MAARLFQSDRQRFVAELLASSVGDFQVFRRKSDFLWLVGKRARGVPHNAGASFPFQLKYGGDQGSAIRPATGSGSPSAQSYRVPSSARKGA